MSIHLTDKASISRVIAEMTLEEKARFVTGSDLFSSAPIERLGIPRILFLDAANGVSIRQYCAALLSLGIVSNENLAKLEGSIGIGMMGRLVKIGENLESRENLTDDENQLLDDFRAYMKTLVPCGDYPSCMPCNSLLAASWNPETVLECGRAVGREASAFGVDVLHSPCINIQRDPRGGRSFEGYSEDPYLVSKLAPLHGVGIQEQGVIADVKHFFANNQETDRREVNEIVSERALREIYLPAFEACVHHGIRNVMTGYNWVNGEACAHNRGMIEGILRGEWGFDGFVVSDWGGVYDQVKAVQAGNDLCMPGPRDPQPLVDAVNNGMLDMADLDRAVENILNVVVDMPIMKGRKFTDIDSTATREVAYCAAAEGIILLKNQDNTLPLSGAEKISFIGKSCLRFQDSGVGSGRVHTDKSSSLLKSVAAIIGKEKTSFAAIEPDSDIVVIAVQADGQEGADRPDMRLNSDDDALLQRTVKEAKAMGKKVIAVLNVAAPVELMEVYDQLDAILCVYFPGEAGATAVADILYGKINPSGKLQQSWPKYYRDCPSYRNFPGYNKEVLYGEDIYVGYRYYDLKRIEPLFPFGYGLSYTQFEISDLCLNDEIWYTDENDTFEVTVRVTNCGSRPGKEVVQLYLNDERSTLDRPVKELKSFEKVFLAPGESKVVCMTLNRRDLMAYDTGLKCWVCEPGWFTVLVGNSSRNITVTGRFKARGKNPYCFSGHTQFAKLNSDPRAVEVIVRNMNSEGVDAKYIDNVCYFSKHVPFEDVWNTSLHSKLVGRTDAEKRAVYEKIIADFEAIDLTETSFGYKETNVF